MCCDSLVKKGYIGKGISWPAPLLKGAEERAAADGLSLSAYVQKLVRADLQRRAGAGDNAPLSPEALAQIGDYLGDNPPAWARDLMPNFARAHRLVAEDQAPYEATPSLKKTGEAVRPARSDSTVPGGDSQKPAV